MLEDGLLSESQRWDGAATFAGRDGWDVMMQGLRLRHTQIQHPDHPEYRNAWIYATVEARRRILAEVKDKATVKDRLLAYARNLSNIFGNPNQFLAAGLKDANIEFRESSGLLRTKLPYTHGGAVIESDIWPESPVAGFVLIFNGLIYTFIVMSTLMFLISRQLSETEKVFRLFSIAAILSFLFMIFVHPGHGRYVFQIMPLMMFCASLFWSRKLWPVNKPAG